MYFSSKSPKQGMEAIPSYRPLAAQSFHYPKQEIHFPSVRGDARNTLCLRKAIPPSCFAIHLRVAVGKLVALAPSFLHKGGFKESFATKK